MSRICWTILSVFIIQFTVSGAWVNVTNNLAGKSCACGNIYCMAAVPNQNKVIVGVCGNIGMFASTDNGASWQALGASTGWVDPQTIVFDKTNPEIFWEIGIHGGQIHKTTDGGKTFTVLNGGNGDGMSVDMSDPQRLTMVSGGHEGTNLNKSLDGGSTWTSIAAGTSGWTNFPVVVNSQIFLVGSTNGGGIQRTTNGGSSWTKVSNTGVNNGGPAVDPNGGIYFVSSNGQAILKSIDQGATWTSITKTGDGSGFDEPIIMPDNSIVALGASGLMQCSDGKTWKAIGSAIPSTGMTKGHITYNSVSQAFFMAFWNCGSTIPTQALWRQDFSSQASHIAVRKYQKNQIVPAMTTVILYGRSSSIINEKAITAYNLFGQRIQQTGKAGAGIAIARNVVR